MIQDIYPFVMKNEYRPCAPSEESFALYFADDSFLIGYENDRIRFPRFKELGPLEGFKDYIYLFSINDDSFFLLHNKGFTEPEGYKMENLQLLRDGEPRHMAFAGFVASQIARWYDNHRYCGKCAGPLVHHEKERSLVCGTCNILEYPKISPAVIIAVTDGDKLLMSRYANRPFRRYALLAGFAEVGETIEETVSREVFEEVGIRVKNIRYYKSQPWAFSDSMLFGFFAELDGSGEITLDENELSEAKWIPRSEIPEDRSNFSLTGEMIELFRSGKFV